jgi:glycosyltransferase involved in cell wall biosynthesis
MRSLGIPSERISVGLNVVDNSHFARNSQHARENASHARRDLGLPGRYFLCVSRFVAKKNLHAMLKAFASYLSNGGIPRDLVLAGDGILKESLLHTAQQLGVSDLVHFLGFAGYAELPSIYGLADALVLPSLSEQWGLVVNEAMAAGIPVLVSSKCGCAKDLVKPGLNGYLFEPTSVEGLTDALLALPTTEGDLSAMGRAAEATVKEWSPQRFAAGLCKAIRAASGPIALPRLWTKAILRLKAGTRIGSERNPNM